MDKLAKLSITTRLSISFLLIIIFLFGTSIYSQYVIYQTNVLHDANINFVLERRSKLQAFNAAFERFYRTLELFMTHEVLEVEVHPQLFEHGVNSLTEAVNEMETIVTTYILSLNSDPHLSEHDRMRNIAMISIMQNNVAQLYRNVRFNTATTRRYVDDEALDLAIRLIAYNIYELTPDINIQAQDRQERVDNLHLTYNNIMMFVLLLATVISIVLAILNIRLIARSLYNLRVHIQKIKAGGMLVLEEGDDEITAIVNEVIAIAEESNNSKNRFLARMSHEVRTPLTAVLGISEIQLKKPSIDIDTEEAFAKIHDSSKVLLNIINDILDLSKIDAGKLDINDNTYEVTSLIIDTVQLHMLGIGSKPIAFEVSIDERVPTMMVGDELRIKQIMNNVLSNAFKYTEQGTITLDIFYKQDMLHIVITDTGFGMTEEQLEHINQEYIRFHEESTPYIQGTGLGIPIVYQLLELMSGHMSVTSKPGEGTKVTIKIPQKVASEGRLGAKVVDAIKNHEFGDRFTKKSIGFTPTSLPHGKVLIVDDIDTNLFVASRLIKLYDIKVETAISGELAIAKVKAGNTYDIIFLDYMMPGLDGMETAKILRGLGYTAPIVALTANAIIGESERFLKNGFDGFISKPIESSHLNGILMKFIPQEPEDISEDIPDMDELDDEAFLQALRKEFYQSKREIGTEIEQSVAYDDCKRLTFLSHSIKGIAYNIDEPSLAKLAGQVEADANKGVINKPLVEELVTLVNTVLKAIENAS